MPEGPRKPPRPPLDPGSHLGPCEHTLATKKENMAYNQLYGGILEIRAGDRQRLLPSRRPSSRPPPRSNPKLNPNPNHTLITHRALTLARWSTLWSCTQR